MILKKPYAFLIKNFRIIHIILTCLSIFIAYKGHTIVSFFRNFINNNYSVTVTDNLVDSTIGVGIYIAIVLSIIISIAVYILLRTKQKPNKIYLMNILYLIIVIIFLVIASILIGGLSDSLWSSAEARTYRDLSQMVYYPCYIFLVVFAIRALGFNVKQFNFKSDAKDLEITDNDSEEVELNINFPLYKVKRGIRRLLREFKYYFQENKPIFFVIGIVLVLVIGYLFYQNFEKLKYNYDEGDSFVYNNLTISITDSILTNVDLNGDTIYEDKYYVVIKMTITNNSKEDKYLDYDNLKLYYDDESTTPTLDLGNYFLDYGDPFMNDVIPSGESVTYIMPYMIDEEYKDSDFKIHIYLGNSTKSTSFLAKTASIDLNPTVYENVTVIRTAELNETVSLASTLLGNASITINSALISNRYEYKYESCYQTSCRTYTDVVVSDNSYQTRQALLVMDYELVLDNSSDSYKNVNDLKGFASNFLSIEYTIDDTTERINVSYVNPAKVNDKIILQADGAIADADSVRLLITIRNRQYVINLI